MTDSEKCQDEVLIEQQLVIGNLHATIKRLREMLAIEFLRHDRVQTPWDCVERDCPRFNKCVPRTGCNCFLEFQAKHVSAVKKELGLSK